MDPSSSVNIAHQPFVEDSYERHRYNASFKDKTVIVERNIALEKYTDPRIIAIFCSELNGLCGEVRAAKKVFVQEFYSALRPPIPGTCQIPMKVRGVSFIFSDDLIATILRLPRLPGCQFPNLGLNPSLVASTLFGEPTQWNGRTQLDMCKLTPFYSLLNTIVIYNILPRIQPNKICWKTVLLLYCLGEGIEIDIPRIIFHDIRQAAFSDRHRRGLPFGSLLTIAAELLQIPIDASEEVVKPKGPLTQVFRIQGIFRGQDQQVEEHAPQFVQEPPLMQEPLLEQGLNFEQGEPLLPQGVPHDQGPYFEQGEASNTPQSELHQRIDHLTITILSGMTALSQRMDKIEELLFICHNNILRVHDQLQNPPMNANPSMLPGSSQEWPPLDDDFFDVLLLSK